MAIGHTYRVRALGTLRGSRVEFGLHVRHDSGAADATAFVAHFVANVGPLITGATSSEVNWDEVMITDTSPDGEESKRTTLTQPYPGLITGECLPGQNAIVVSLSTGQKGRRKHGRFYLPGVSESSSSNGVVTGSQLTAAQALGNGLENFYGPSGIFAGWRMVVYSPIDTTPPPPRKWKAKETELVTPILETRVDPIIRTQRRRAIGVGR